MSFSYIATTDPYPHQTPDYNQLHPFFDHLREGRLTTTRCRDCGQVTWPPKGMCPACASGNLEWADLPGEGAIVACTVAERGIPAGFPVPTVFVLVQVGPVRILSRLVDADPGRVSPGMAVRADAVRVPGTPLGEDRVLPVFRLITNAGPAADQPQAGEAGR